MSYTWLVPEPLPSFFDNRIFGKQISASRALAVTHALEHLVHSGQNDVLREIKVLDNDMGLSNSAREVLGSDLERAFRVTVNRSSKRNGVLQMVDDVLKEQDGSFSVERGRYQREFSRALFTGRYKSDATQAAQYIGHVYADEPDLFKEVRRSRDFAIPNEPRFQTFFSMLAAGRLTNEKGLSARTAELVIFSTDLESGQPILGVS